ncbi:MAG: iron-sulfur cluster assembly scaffold protein [Deltaproteobacteria bacterium]|nr:iron-sulfur cluster assembly scaffold protein [Candidatus Anaeroferrophillacea bacterium]
MNEIIRNHFLHPRNMGALENPTITARGGDPGCGDYVELELEMDGEEILAVAARVHGCPYAIATTSAFTELIRGRMLSDALEVDDHAVEAVLGGLPEAKRHCSVMGPEALRRAASEFILMHVVTPCGVGDDAQD